MDRRHEHGGGKSPDSRLLGCDKSPTVAARYTASLNRASVTVPHFDERIFNIAGRTWRTQNARESGQQHGGEPVRQAGTCLPAQTRRRHAAAAAAAHGVR
jgi:hypothetical protein